MMMMRTLQPCLAAAALLAALAAPARAQERVPPPTGEETDAADGTADVEEEDAATPFRLGGEIKVHYRDSEAAEVPVAFPFPPNFRPNNDPNAGIFLRTVAPGRSLEVSTLTLRGEGEIASAVAAKVEVHVLDLYNRNPTSSDDRIFLREAWIRVGRRPEPLRPVSGTSAYVLVGLAPRFTKQTVRRMESYGLWGTAVGRFEQPQVQVGATIGRHLYLRGMVGNGNPLFFRDPNALAGDNGTPERQPGNVDPIFQSGFPILYDAKPQDLNPSGSFEWGGGLGVRAGGAEWAVDGLGWIFQRDLQDVVRLRGTSYSGDIRLLRGVSFPLPFSGRRKREAGVNVEGRFHGGRLFAQYVDQDIAELPRRGYEAEVAWRFGLGGLFAVGDSPVGNWIQPVARVSDIDNRFVSPRQFPAPSVSWDWVKYDFGVRIGVVAPIDLTIEYSRHTATRANGTKVHPDEFLVTLNALF